MDRLHGGNRVYGGDLEYVHYPGTYLAGGYNRLKTSISGREIQNEDLVDLPNGLPLVMSIDGSDWLRPDQVTYLDYRQHLDLKQGVLSRALRFRDEAGRVSRWEEKRILSMHDQHLAALDVTVTPENWSGRLALRSSLDGSVINWGVERYRELASRHLETLSTGHEDGGILTLRSRMVEARREIALAARTAVQTEGAHVAATRSETLPDLAHQEFELEAQEGRPVRVEKIAALFNSQDRAISEPLLEAVKHIRRAGPFRDLLNAHSSIWAGLWDQFDIRIESTADEDAQLKLKLTIFHLLQTVSSHSVDMDVACRRAAGMETPIAATSRGDVQVQAGGRAQGGPDRAGARAAVGFRKTPRENKEDQAHED